MKTLYLWIYGRESIENIIRSMGQDVSREIEALDRRARGVTKKNVKGHVYLYEWIDGQHVYLGKSNPGLDVFQEIGRKKVFLWEEFKSREKELRSVVVRSIGPHLIVSKVLKGACREDVIELSKLSARSSSTSRRHG